jgi:hypothetical protein
MMCSHRIARNPPVSAYHRQTIIVKKAVTSRSDKAIDLPWTRKAVVELAAALPRY